ncbi:YeeE/YedE thiosulfate transporter family protein, partial [Kytococcus sp. HMSC28H12]|uniref:YeeE/YedE thiosulfate transporter family protein n=1 Tax=Kytococcus sp. HMSC28H12 TaxID=1581067 RepID=UPI001EDAEEF6
MVLVGALLGLVMQRGRFCVTGAFRDVWLSGSTRWLTAFGLVVALHAVGYLALTATGVVSPEVDPLPLGAAVVGGLVFGAGIIAAGGCATGTYYRADEGLVGSWFALTFFALSAAVMKYGPLAGGCTVGHGMVATAQLSWEGWGATGSMLLGADVGTRLFVTARQGRTARADAADQPATERPAPALTPV